MRDLKTTLRDRRWWTLAAIITVMVVSAALAAYGLLSADGPRAAEPDRPATQTPGSTAQPSATPVASATPLRWTSILNGAPMSEDQWNARKDLLPIAIMIDNTAGAVRHVGLDRADVVYEAFVEAGITRFMAVYWSQEADLVLPVRSARTPFVVWADELGALYAHAGAAATNNDADASGQIFEWGILDLNAFAPGPSTAYNRDSDRYAPYNLATSTARLREAAGRLGFAGPPRVETWSFKVEGEGVASRPVAEAIQIEFQERATGWQTIQWRWDKATNSYLRFQFGAPFVDGASKQQIRAANIIVMRVPWDVVDQGGHVLLEQFGSGEATIFLDGRVVTGTWTKADRRGRTRFYDASGTEVAFNRGPIWIEVAGPASKLVTAVQGAEMLALPPYCPPPPAAPPEEPEDRSPATTPSPSATTIASPTATPVATPRGSQTPDPTPAKTTPVPSPTAEETPVASSTSNQ